MGKVGDNSAGLKAQIQSMAVDYAKCDESSMLLNQKRAEIRDRAKSLGLDTKAWQDCISRMKSDMKKKEGYDESVLVIKEALGEMIAEDLFAHVAKMEREKEEAREAKKKERESEIEKNETFKPATERKPKSSNKNIGGQQAEILTAAHPVIQ